MFFGLLLHSISAQDLDKNVFEKVQQVEKMQQNEPFDDVLQYIDNQVLLFKEKIPEQAYLRAYKSRFYTLNDSLILAKKEADLSMSLAEQSENVQARAAALLAAVYINGVLGLNDDVVKNAKEGLAISTKSDDYFTVFLLNYKLYASYSDWEDVDKMKFYAQEAVKVALKSKNNNALANAYNATSSAFLSEYENINNQSLIDSSWTYLQKSFDLYRTYPADISKTTLSVTCNNIANHFLSHSNLDPYQAKKRAFDYLDLVEKFPQQDALILASINGIKSVFALRENDLATGKTYLEKAQNIIEQEPRKNFGTKIQIYRSLAAIASAQNDFKTALHYSQKINETQSELFNEQQRYNAQKIEIQYEVEKKNQELKFLATEVALQQKQNYLYIGIIIVSVVGLIFMFRSYHFRLRYSIERERKAQLEKEDAEKKILLEQEEKQRLKAEQELLEMQQLQLQQEAMATVLQVQRKNEVLQEIKNKLAEQSDVNLKKIFREEDSIDSDFEEVKMQIQKIYPNFFQQLQDRAQQKLSLLDLKYCAYIHLKMSTRQIAQLLHVEPSSVRMFKYRLKQKFALSKEEDLDTFLQEVR